MNFEIYVTETTEKPKPIKSSSNALDSFIQKVDRLGDFDFSQAELNSSLNVLLKNLLEDSGITSQNKRRDHIIDEARELATYATKLFLYSRRSYKVISLCKVCVEIRWDGESKVVSTFFDLPQDQHAQLSIQFTTMDKFRSLDSGYYLVVIPSNSIDRGDYLSYSIASVHPNIVVVGSCFLSDYNPSLIVGYAKLDLNVQIEAAFNQNQLNGWERKK